MKSPGRLALVLVTLSAALAGQTISSVSPNDACFNGPSFTMTVNGSGFIYAGGFGNSSVVRWNGTNLPTTAVSSSQLTATVAASYLAIPGQAAITVFNQHLIGPPSTSNTATFTVNTFAQIDHVSPSVFCADGTSASIEVFSTTNLSGYSVRWNSNTISSSNYGYYGNGLYYRHASIPASYLDLQGIAQVRLRSPDGCDSSPVTVTMQLPPAITSISPTWKPQGSTTFTMTVNGSSFQPSHVVNWDGISLPTTYVTAGQLQATVDDSFLGRLGSATISVTGGPCGSASGSQTFDVIGPTITSVSPTAIGVGASTVTLTVNGAGMTTNTSVLFDGTAVTTNYVSATQVTAVVPASLLATMGTKAVSLRHYYIGLSPQFAFSGSKAFTVQGPTLQRLLPDRAPAASAQFTMTLRGTSLHDAGAFVPPLVRWNGVNHPATVVDNTTLQVTITAAMVAAAGTATVDVLVPQSGGGSRITNAMTFTIDPAGISDVASGWTVSTGGSVNATLVSGTTLYVAGSFDYVGPITGPAAAFSTVYGFPQNAMPLVNGTVNSVVADGSGGWFIGGSFSAVGPLARSNLARISANGLVDPYFNAGTNGPVNCLSVTSGGTLLYVGGAFTRLNHGPRHNLGAVSVANGELNTFNPCLNGPVTSVAAEGVWIIAVGGFTVAAWSETPIDGLTALFPTTGDYYDWDFGGGGNAPPGTPELVRSDGVTVYIVTSSSFSARSIFDGSPTSFGSHNFAGGGIRDLEIQSSLVFIAGGFTTVDGQPRGRVASFDKANGALQSFDPGANGEVWAIDETGGTLYAGGDFTQFAGVEQRRLGSVLFNFGTPGYFQPGAENGGVRNLRISGSIVAAFGTFNSAGGEARKDLAAVDLASGTVIAGWQADTGSPGSVRMLAADASWLYVGGIFTTLDGQPKNRLGRVGLASGNIDPAWNPSPNGQVDAITMGPGCLFVGGYFTTIGGASRAGLAGVDLATGAATSFDVPVNNTCHALVVQGSTLYLGGHFTQVGSEPRTYVGAVDLATGTVADFAPVLNGSCEAIIAAGGTVFIGGGFFQVDGVARRLAALRASDGLLLPFNPSPDGSILGMTLSGSTLFVGGSFNNVAGQSHPKVVAIDLGTQLPRSWTPPVTGTVESVDIAAGRIFVGGQLGAGGLSGMAAYALGGPFPTPVLSSLGTTSAGAGSPSFTLSLLGSTFTTGSACRFGGVYVPTAFVSATQLQATIDAALLVDAGVRSVDVVAPAPGAGVSQALSFSINNPAPVASSLSPPTAPYNGAALTLSVFGSGFTSQSVVRWNGSPLPTTPVSSGEVHASVATGLLGTAGSASITVFNPAPGGGTSGALSFTVEFPAPGATSLVPASQLAGAGAFSLTVNGGPFYAGSVVRWDGVPLSTTYVNGTQLSAQVGASLLAQAGNHAVDAVNPMPGGGPSGSLTFSVLNPLPQCSSLSPSTALAGAAGFTLQVTGSAFVASSVVRWNGANLPTTFVSPTLLQATVATAQLAAAATVPVDVTTPAPGGGTSGSQAFVVANPVPSAALLSPATVAAGSPTFALGVSGTGFNGQSVVLANGAPVPTSLVDSTHLSAQIAATLIAGGGTVGIAVSNPAPGGGSSGSLSLAVDNPVPVLAQLAPSSVPAGVPAFQLVLTGSGFVPGSWVTWNGITLATTFISQSQINAAVYFQLTAFGGSATVAVSSPTPGGGTSSALLFSVVAPVVTAISPGSSNLLQPTDPPILLTITGSGFSPAAVAYAGDAALATFYSSATQLFATVPSSMLQTWFPSALAISVLDGTAHSNGLPLRFGTGLNQGWIMKSPPSPAPGAPFAIVIEGCDPGAPFTLFWDGGAIPPITPFPTAAANEVLALNPLSPTLAVIFDGLGFAGPAQPIAFGAVPQGPAPGGRFVLQGLVHPNPPLGATLSLQAAYPSAGSSWGIHLTWGVLMTF